MIFREFQDCVCAGLAELAEEFTSPDDDWASMAFLEDHAGRLTVVPLGAAAGAARGARSAEQTRAGTQARDVRPWLGLRRARRGERPPAPPARGRAPTS